MARIITVRFINKPGNTLSDKGYDFILTPSAFQDLERLEREKYLRHTKGRSVASLNIVTTNGENYNNGRVILEKVEERTLSPFSSSLKSLRSIAYSGESYSLTIDTSCNPYDLSPLKTTTPKKMKEDTTMPGKTSSLMNRFGLSFGKATNVEFSPFGPAFVVSENPKRAIAYDATKKGYVDVDTFSVDALPFFKMPATVAQLVVGDFIERNGEWVRVSKIDGGKVVEIENPITRTVDTVLPVGNMWGLDFYTKLWNPMNGASLTGAATSGNNFASFLPFMLMDGDMEDNDMMPLLMFSALGGSTSPFGNMNPMMLMMLMGKGESGGGMGGMMKMMLMSQLMQGGLTAPTTSTPATSAT